MKVDAVFRKMMLIVSICFIYLGLQRRTGLLSQREKSSSGAYLFIETTAVCIADAEPAEVV